MKRFTWSLLLVLFCASAFAESPKSFDWPQWQGPDRNATSKEQGLLKEWPENGPPLAWRIDGLGGGYGTPAIAAGRIIGISNRGDDEVVWALSEADGKTLWTTSLGSAYREGPPQGVEGAGCTPTIDGQRLYVLGLGGDLACLQAQDGKILWQRSLTKDFGGRVPMWRYNESPLIDGNKVICTPGGENATMVALDKLTGKTIWKCKVPDEANAGSGTSDGPDHGRNGAPDMMQLLPVLVALDADRNKEISADEITNSPNAIGKLDKNQDGKLTEDEVSPQIGGPGAPGGQNRPPQERPGGMMRFMPIHATLDADRNNEIDDAEIKDSAAALRKLDRNNDGKLTSDEVGPRMGGGRRGPTSSAAYSSAIAIDFDGQRQYVQLTAKALVGVAASDGKLLWRYDRPANNKGINCSTPLHHDGLVFAASAYSTGGGLVKLSKEANGDIKAEEVYFTKKMQNHHGGMILYDGCLYGANGGNGGGYLNCLDFQTGDVLWSTRKAPKGSITFADGRLYYFTEKGTMLLIEPNREEYIECGRFDQPDRSKSPAWTHPIIANGKLYVRDQDLLFCYDVKAK